MTPLRLVVFDMDGTLIDSQDFIVEAMTRAFAEMGRPVPARPEILSIVGLSLPQAVARLAPDMDARAVEEGAERYKRSFIDLRAERGGEAAAPMYPGARAALERLHPRDELFLGVATGKARRGLDHAFSAHGIGHFFHTSQTADDHPSKPHPSMLLAALRETGVEAEEAVMVGDTTFDIEMGRAAGYRTIGVSWGYHPARALHAAGADIVIDEFDALDRALNMFWERAA
ncbi:HAD-IA family hydrolase [Actibacterium sp. MT2.3-13A]|uniref:HAD-IA family hydrolase n=1 Tax=Actibacterium sp. MT2.3-13A TaxID=2828332 RepID=UPI001BAE0AAC|nr:HAD-IA family hydrolase [Actibacterium sp. MT2.3-13A]